MGGQLTDVGVEAEKGGTIQSVPRVAAWVDSVIPLV